MKTMIANDIMPFKSTHPGELLKDELAARGITQKRFAELVQMPYTALNEIINGKRPVSTDFAMLLEAALGIRADMWVNLQSTYNMQMARRDKTLSERLDMVRKVCASFL